ncbi:sugar ABC transporter permease [Polymorphospora sp. NPDC050346]|uniref:carbohydrate ABC transporter permease n=1 Tax=Polymorphospora sp. NPDC050346 TaxID=3155780 RepID=UPI0033CE2663
MDSATKSPPRQKTPRDARSAGRAVARPRASLRIRMVFFGPLLVLMVGLLAFPILFALYASFADVDNLFSLEFAGLTNYESLLARPETLSGPLVNTLRFTLGSVVLALALGFGAALLLNGRLAGRRVMRSAFMFPWVIPTVVTALLWRWIMDSNAGAFNGLLLQLRIIDQPVSWLGEPQLAPWIIILAQVWRGFPFIMVMLLAAMQTIPAELHEAAAVDGAGPLRRLVSITWPGVRPIFILVGTLEGLYAFREFAMIDVVTGGGPAGATEVLATQVYRLFFQYHRFGDAMALAALMFVLALIATLFLMRMAARGEED